jgi:hypothetical protein
MTRNNNYVSGTHNILLKPHLSNVGLQSHLDKGMLHPGMVEVAYRTLFPTHALMHLLLTGTLIEASSPVSELVILTESTTVLWTFPRYLDQTMSQHGLPTATMAHVQCRNNRTALLSSQISTCHRIRAQQDIRTFVAFRCNVYLYSSRHLYQHVTIHECACNSRTNREHFLLWVSSGLLLHDQITNSLRLNHLTPNTVQPTTRLIDLLPMRRRLVRTLTQPVLALRLDMMELHHPTRDCRTRKRLIERRPKSSDFQGRLPKQLKQFYMDQY